VRFVDANNLADLPSALDVETDAFAELQKLRQSGHTVKGRRHFSDGSPYPHRREVLQTMIDCLLEMFERIHDESHNPETVVRR
jgi:hypothetical protein